MVVGLTALDLHVFHVPSFCLSKFLVVFPFFEMWRTSNYQNPPSYSHSASKRFDAWGQAENFRCSSVAMCTFQAIRSVPAASKACCNAIRSANLSDIRLNGQVITFFFLPWCFPTLLRTLRKESEKRNKNMNFLILSNYPSIFRNEKWTTVLCWGSVNIKEKLRHSGSPGGRTSHRVTQSSICPIKCCLGSVLPGPVPKNYGKRKQIENMKQKWIKWQKKSGLVFATCTGNNNKGEKSGTEHPVHVPLVVQLIYLILYGLCSVWMEMIKETVENQQQDAKTSAPWEWEANEEDGRRQMKRNQETSQNIRHQQSQNRELRPKRSNASMNHNCQCSSEPPNLQSNQDPRKNSNKEKEG